MRDEELIAAHKAPESISLRVCPVCGKDDKLFSLPREHYKPRPRGLDRCPGTPVRVDYQLADWQRYELKQNEERVRQLVAPTTTPEDPDA